jgi:hypothetical protein
MIRVHDGEATRQVIQEALALAVAGTPTDEVLARLRAHDGRTRRNALRVLRKGKSQIDARAAVLLVASLGDDGGESLPADTTVGERELIRLGPDDRFRQLAVRMPPLALLEAEIRAQPDAWEGQDHGARACRCGCSTP